AKYWGKSDIAHNVPAVPSISLTLEELVTETEVCFEPGRKHDEFLLDGRQATAAETQRAAELLDRVRSAAGIEHGATVTSTNHFPTAAGLASSASGFAALAAAATKAAGQELDLARLSALARRSSASAARSVFGGFVELAAGAPGEDELAAKPISPRRHWDLRLVLAITAAGPKSVGSTEAMERSRTTSPFYEAWIASAPGWCETVKQAIHERDLEALGTAMEQSTLSFHCCAITSQPSTLYWSPATVAALQTVTSLRAKGVPVWSTMDAGPHVKALCEAGDAARVRNALTQTPGVLRVLVATPGSGVEVGS
ncbi:MAG: diphosphomevalonate decarboxylase, partial [Polyangiales bacterium]